ncbi:prolyl oligopeptidase family serine peptidase, partial [Micromonospora sp. NPDC047753]|uniref:acyl carrier protein n=1 Tax=Micromonospora sp. NPDC047753 TaxID=3154817 RepID=UPI0033ECA104
MNELSRAQIRDLMAQVLKNQDKELPADDAAQLREIGFRSLDFSELALRVEAHTRGGGELGRRWYDQGKLLAKKNTFTDFVA